MVGCVCETFSFLLLQVEPHRLTTSRLTTVSSSNSIVSQMQLHRLTNATKSSHKRKFVEPHRLTTSSHSRQFVELHRLTNATKSSHKRKLYRLTNESSTSSHKCKLHRLTNATSSNCIVSQTKVRTASSHKNRLSNGSSSNCIVSQTQLDASSHKRKFISSHKRYSRRTVLQSLELCCEGRGEVDRVVRPAGWLEWGLSGGIGREMGDGVGTRLHVAQGTHLAFQRPR